MRLTSQLLSHNNYLSLVSIASTAIPPVKLGNLKLSPAAPAPIPPLPVRFERHRPPPFSSEQQRARLLWMPATHRWSCLRGGKRGIVIAEAWQSFFGLFVQCHNHLVSVIQRPPAWKATENRKRDERRSLQSNCTFYCDSNYVDTPGAFFTVGVAVMLV